MVKRIRFGLKTAGGKLLYFWKPAKESEGKFNFEGKGIAIACWAVNNEHVYSAWEMKQDLIRLRPEIIVIQSGICLRKWFLAHHIYFFIYGKT